MKTSSDIDEQIYIDKDTLVFLRLSGQPWEIHNVPRVRMTSSLRTIKNNTNLLVSEGVQDTTFGIFNIVIPKVNIEIFISRCIPIHGITERIIKLEMDKQYNSSKE